MDSCEPHVDIGLVKSTFNTAFPRFVMFFLMNGARVGNSCSRSGHTYSSMILPACCFTTFRTSVSAHFWSSCNFCTMCVCTIISVGSWSCTRMVSARMLSSNISDMADITLLSSPASASRFLKRLPIVKGMSVVPPETLCESIAGVICSMSAKSFE